MTPPTLRPLGIGETLDVAIKIYMRHAGQLIKLVLVVVAPVTLLSVIVQASALSNDNLDAFQVDPVTDEVTFSDEGLWTAIAGVGVSLLLVALASVLATAACFKAVADAYLGQAVDWRGSLRFAARRFGSVLWVTILAGFVTALGLLLCVLPGIWLWFSFAVAVPVLLTEGLKGRKALGRSRRLVQGRWWRVFAALLLGLILTSIVSGALTALATVFASDDPTSIAGMAVDWVSQTVSSALTTPFGAALAIVIYFDLRVRKEAFDLQLLAEQLGVDPPEGVPSMPLAPVTQPPGGREQPPFWPPPPGWTPTPRPLEPLAPLAHPPADDPPAGDPPADDLPAAGVQPPFWPPPPGWTPTPRPPQSTSRNET